MPEAEAKSKRVLGRDEPGVFDHNVETLGSFKAYGSGLNRFSGPATFEKWIEIPHRDADPTAWGTNERGRTFFHTTANLFKFWDGSQFLGLVAGPVIGFTEGAIPFGGSGGGFIDEDPTKLYWTNATDIFNVVGTSNLDGAVVINESNADKDFRVEGSGATYTHLLFTDASANKVGVNEDAPKALFHIRGATCADYAGLHPDTYLLIENDDDVAIQLQCATDGNAFIVFADDAYNPPPGRIKYNHTDVEMDFSVAGDVALTIFAPATSGATFSGRFVQVDSPNTAWFIADSHDSDAYFELQEDNVTKWTMGFDYSDSLKFQISEGIPGTNVVFEIPSGQGSLHFVRATNKGLQYKDTGSAIRWMLRVATSTNVVEILNQAQNGKVEIHANTNTAGSGGDTLVATFEDTDITLANGIGLNLQEDINFTGATTENQLKFPDNLEDAFSMLEGANKYVTFITTNGEEDILFSKPIDIHHTASYADDHALEIDVDAANYGDIKAIDVAYITGTISAGQDEGVVLVNIDKTIATGGDIFGLEVLATDQVSGTTGVYGMKVGPGIGPVHQDSGTFINPTLATDNTPTTHVSIMADGILANTTAIFTNNSEYIIIGADAAFQDMELVFSTPASKSIRPTFWYSTSGTDQFTEFTPVDGTDGCKHTGVISWDASDLSGHVADDVTGKFDIKIIRTKAGNMTTPVLGYAKTAATTEYIWDKNGDVNIRKLALASIVNADTDTDKFLVLDASGNVDFRTGANVLSDIGGLANIVEDTTPQLGGDLDLNGKNIDFPSVANISDCKDEDNMASDSPTMLATQQSIKAYVDASGGNHAILDGSVHTDSVADGVTRGSIIYGNPTPKWDELVLGAADTFLGSDGTDLSYRTAAQVLASLSGEAGAAFAWNSQNLTGIGTIGCGAITSTGSIIIADAGNIGSASDTDAIGIGAGGEVTFTQTVGIHGEAPVATHGIRVGRNTGLERGVVCEVNAATADNYAILCSATGAGTTNYGLYVEAANATTNWALWTDVGNVWLNGIPTTDSGDYDLRFDAVLGVCYNTSDGRQKENRVPLEYGLAEILQLQPKRYVYYEGLSGKKIDSETGKVARKNIKITDKGKSSLGLIAQEVWNVIPEAVYKPPDENVAFWGLRENRLIPILINAIKELNAKIEAKPSEA